MINTSQNSLGPATGSTRSVATPALKALPALESKDAPQVQDQVQLTPTPTPAEAVAPEPVKLKEATGEMALMVDSMQAAEERMKLAGNDVQQAIVQEIWANRENSHAPMAILDEGAAPPLEHSSAIDGFLSVLVADQVKQPEDLHQPATTKPAHKPRHGLLGGHLGIEGGEHLAQGIVGAKSHAVEVAQDLLSVKSHAVDAVAQSGDAVDAAVTGGQNVVHEAAEHGGQVAEAASHAASGWMSALTGALSAGSGVLGVVMLAVGIHDVKHGLKHKDLEHTVEGANHMVVGTRSLAAGATMAGHLIHGSEVVTTIAGFAKSALTPLGVFHGAVDAGIGVKHVVEGIKAKDGSKITEGGLGIGLGVSLVAAAVGGGIPALVTATIFLGGKIAHGIREHRVAAETGAHNH